MIHEAKDELCEHGFRELEQVTDSHGTVGYVLQFLNQRYVLVAKQYAHEGKASFLERLVVNAPMDLLYIFYCDDDRSYTVFDGEYLREHGVRSSGMSKKTYVHWRELPLDRGADLHEFLHQRASPRTLAGGNGTLDSFA